MALFSGILNMLGFYFIPKALGAALLTEEGMKWELSRKCGETWLGKENTSVLFWKVKGGMVVNNATLHMQACYGMKLSKGWHFWKGGKRVDWTSFKKQ